MAQQTLQRNSLADIIQQMLQQSYGGLENNQSNNAVQTIQAQMAAKDPQYATGAAIGSLLKALKLTPQDWVQNYMERGALKNELQDKLTKDFGDGADERIAALKNQGIWNDYRKLSEYANSQQPNQLLGDTRTWEQKEEDYLRQVEEERLKKLGQSPFVDSPFQ